MATDHNFKVKKGLDVLGGTASISGGHLTLTSNSYGVNTRSVLARDVNGLNLGTANGTTALSIDNSGNVSMPYNLTVTGNLTVAGTTTTIDTANLNVEDNNITLNYSTGDSSSTANGAGITIQDAVNSSTDAFMNWNGTYDIFQFSHSATFGYTTIDPDLFLGTSGGFGHIADGSGWGARGLYIQGGGTGDAAAIGHNGSNLYFGIQNGSSANSMDTWLTVNPTKVANFAAQVNVDGPIATTHGSGTLTISGDSSGNNYIEGSGEFRFRPSGTTVNKFVIGSNGNLVTAGTLSTSGKVSIAASGTNSVSTLKLHVGTINNTGSSAIAQFGGFIRASDYYILHATPGSTDSLFIDYVGDDMDITQGEGSYNGGLRANAYRIGSNGTTVIDSSRNLLNIGTISSGAITASGSSVFNPTSDMVIVNEPSTNTDLQTAMRVGTSAGGLYLTTNNAIISKGAYYDGGWIATSTAGSSIDFTGNNRITFNTFSGATVGGAAAFGARAYIDASGLNVTGTGAFSGKLTINNASYANHLELVRGSDTLYLTPSGGQLITNGGLSPDVTNQDDLGRTDKYWANLWLGTSLKMGGTVVIDSSRRFGANVAPNASYAINALQNGSLTHAAYLQANGGASIGLEINANASTYSGTALYVRQSTVSTGGNLARFANSSGDKFIVTTAGNVGINVASPSSALDIRGAGSGGSQKNTIAFGTSGWGGPLAPNAALDGGVKLALFEGSTQKVQIGMDGNARLWLASAGSGAQGVDIYTGSSNTAAPSLRFRVDQAGTTNIYGNLNLASSLQVGGTTVIDSSRNLTNIGTISSGAITTSGDLTITKQTPLLTLQTASNSTNPEIRLKSSGGFSGEGFGIYYDNNVGDAHFHTTYANNNAALKFYTATGGSPSTSNLRLKIAGDGKATFFGVLATGTSPAANSTGDLKVIPTLNSSGGVGYAGQVIGVNIEDTVNTSNQPEQLSTWGGVTGSTAIAIQSDDNSYGQFQVWTAPQDSTAGTALTPRFWINGNGNATFAGTLSSGAITSTGRSTFDSVTIDDDGSGSPLLRVVGDDSSPWLFQLENDSATNDGLFQAYVANDNNLWFRARETGAYPTWYFQISNGSNHVTSMYLNSSGINSGGHVDAVSYKVNTTTVIDSSRNISGVNGTFTGKLDVGSGAIGTRSTSLSVNNGDDSSPIAAKSSSSTVWSILPWSSGRTYIASGIYYDDGSWVHDSSDSTNCLFAIAGSGVSWYSSNNSSGSWNVASDVDLWDNTGTWVGQVDTGSSVDAASGFKVNGTLVIDTNKRLLVSDGSASAPYMTFAADTNTGIYRNASDDFGFATAGASRGRFNNDGLALDNNSNLRGQADSGIYTYHSSIGGFVLKPGGAQYTTSTSSVTGACKIQLPVYASNDMISFWVDIYNYSAGTMTSYYIGGYVYQTEGNNEWVHESAICIAEESNTTTACRTVRFGVESNKHCIWIGDTDDTWSYPQVVVRDFQGGYATNIDEWADGWSLSFVTSFGTVDHTRATSGPRIGNEAGDVSVRRDLYLEGNSTRSQIGMKANGAIRGYVYANSSNDIGFLDNSAHWAIRHINHSGTQFRQNNAIIASIGAGQVGGDYGSMVVNDTKNGWGGYSINNRVVFMHNNSTTSGIYNDVNNHWMIKTINEGQTELYHNGTKKLETTSGGVLINTGNLQRETHNSGHLEGGHNNIGSTAAKTSPIYTIGSSYNPNSTTLSNMYGIGFGHSGNGTFLTGVSALTQGNTGWGQYVASDGDARIFLNAEAGTILSTGQHYAAGNLVWNAGNDGSGSGLDADKVDGLHAHSNTDRQNHASKLVTTDGNGYIQAGWINTTSGDRGSTIPTRIYGSNDAYIRYYDLASFRSFMNVTAQTGYQGREQNTSDTRYWTGSMGWGAVNMDSLFHYGSGNIDAWNNPSNQPSGTSHWVGSQHLHYTNGSGTAYGHQIVVGAGSPSLMYVRGRWGSSFGSWQKMWNAGNDGSGSGLDADTLDSYEGITYLGKFGNSYYQANTWIDMGPSNGTGLYWSSNTGAGWHINPSGTTTMRMRSGHSSHCYLEINTNGTNRGYVYANSSSDIGFLNNSGSWRLKCVSAGSVYLGGTQQMRINSSSTTAILEGSSTHLVFRNTGSGAISFQKSGGTALGEFTNSGNLNVLGNVTAYGSPSDINLKENIETISNAVEKVQKLDGVTFNYKKDGGRSTGLIAQQLQEVLPEVVYMAEDLDGKEHLAVRYGNTVGLLVEAIKELKEEINELKAQLKEK